MHIPTHPPPTDRHTHTHIHALRRTLLSPAQTADLPSRRRVSSDQVPGKGRSRGDPGARLGYAHRVWPVLQRPTSLASSRSRQLRRRYGPQSGAARPRPAALAPGGRPARARAPRPPAEPPPGCEPAPGSRPRRAPRQPRSARPPRLLRSRPARPALSPSSSPARGPRSAPNPAGRRARTAAPGAAAASVPASPRALTSAPPAGRGGRRCQPGAGSRTPSGRPITHIHLHALPGKHRGLEHRVHTRAHTRTCTHTQPAQGGTRARRTTHVY